MTINPIPAAASTPLSQLPPQYPADIKGLPDPEKKPDGWHQFPHAAKAYLTLEHRFRRRPDVLVAGRGYLCETAAERSNYIVPDCIIASGVNPVAIRDQRNAYVISEVGKPPEFVLEVASIKTARYDCTVKPGRYARWGIAEYWRFDRTGGQLHDAPLAGDRLAGGAYAPIPLTTGADGALWGYSEVLGLCLCWDSGRLRFYDPARADFLPDLAESRDRAEAAEARADADEARANAAAARADAAEAELRRLRRDASE